MKGCIDLCAPVDLLHPGSHTLLRGFAAVYEEPTPSRERLNEAKYARTHVSRAVARPLVGWDASPRWEERAVHRTQTASSSGRLQIASAVTC